MFGSVGNFFSNNPIAGTMLPGSFLTSSYLGKKKSERELDAQKVDPGSPQPWIDPNDIGQPVAGGSAYARMQHQQNALGAQAASQKAAGAGMADVSANRSALAARGGLSSGASERVGMAGMANAANSRQQIAGQMNQANLQGDIGEEALRRSAYNEIRMRNQDQANQLYANNTMSNATLQANKPKGAFGLGFLGL